MALQAQPTKLSVCLGYAAYFIMDVIGKRVLVYVIKDSLSPLVLPDVSYPLFYRRCVFLVDRGKPCVF